MKNLYDERGYQVKLECTRTFNPKERGESDDARNLAVFFTYIGAVLPYYEDAAHSKMMLMWSAGWTFKMGAYGIQMRFWDFTEWNWGELGVAVRM